MIRVQAHTPSGSVPGGRRILFVIGSLEIGGAEQHLVHVATALKRRGWEPELFVLTLGGPLTERLTAFGVPVHGYQLPPWLQSMSNERLKARVGLLLTSITMVRLMWSRRPDVIHFFLPAAYIVGGVAAIVARRRPRIMSRRSMNDYQASHPIYARLERLLHPTMDLICGNSKAVVKQLEDEGIDVNRLRLIYNGIDLSPFDRHLDRLSLRASLGISSDAFVIAIVANLIPYKGHTDLLKALTFIQDELPANWRLLCIGRDDGIGGELRQLAEAYGIGQNICWLGSRADVPDLLRISSVGVLCSHQEGFSNAILEGMAAGLPMVVTDVGGNAEAVIDCTTGYVVPAKNPAMLAKALMQVVHDDDFRVIGERGRRRVDERFSLSACVDAYEALYREVGAGLLDD